MYSPRVRNLQTEMDLLRTEIQRLKAIDIYADPPKPIYPHCPYRDSRTLPHSKKETVPMSKDQRNRMLMQMGLTSYKHISDSDTSDGEDSDEAHLGELTKELNFEMPHLGNGGLRHLTEAVTGDGKSDSSRSDDCSIRHHLCISEGTDPIPQECSECVAFREEKLELICRMQQMEEVLHQQNRQATEAEEKMQHYCSEIEEMVRKRSDISHAGTMTEKEWCQTKTPKETAEQSTQCAAERSRIEKLESELEGYQRKVDEMKATNAALSEENGRRCSEEHRRREVMEAEVEALDDKDAQDRLIALLSSAGVPSEWIPSTQTQIQRLFTTDKSTSSSGEQGISEYSSTEHEIKKKQEALQQLQKEKDTEIMQLSAEKDVLAQKVMELRRLIKKESSDKEAAQSEANKLQNDIKEQYSEMEQCRTIVQQKRQQVNELEDSLAIVQHENEKWERDYEILLRKKEQLERELRIARNIESTLDDRS